VSDLLKLRGSQRFSKRAANAASVNWGHVQNQFKKEKIMNKLFKTLSFVFIVVFVAVAFNQAKQAAAAPKNLPYGLTMQDTMASVEQKLGQPNEVHALQAGWKPGLPDEGASPDHITYWATYKRFGLTIVYNTPSASDKSATIRDIIVSE
jgi:hypothetical protein